MPFSIKNIIQGRTSQSRGKWANYKVCASNTLDTPSVGHGHQCWGLGREGSSCEFSTRISRGSLDKNLTVQSFSPSPHSFPFLVTRTVFILSFYGPVSLFPFTSKSNIRTRERRNVREWGCKLCCYSVPLSCPAPYWWSDVVPATAVSSPSSSSIQDQITHLISPCSNHYFPWREKRKHHQEDFSRGWFKSALI